MTEAQRGRSSDNGGSIVKALRVLEAVAAESGFQQLGEVAVGARLPKSTTVRILAILGAEDYVIRHPRRGYAVGPRLRTLGHASGARADSIDDALEEMSRRTGQTSNFALRIGREAIYTHQHDGTQPYRVTATLGTKFELHGTAIGKSILAWLPEDEREQMMAASPLVALTPRTITDLNVLRADLARARVDGFAVDDEENELAIRCIAAPVVGREGGVLGAVSLSAVTYGVAMSELVALAPVVQEAARKIGDLIAGRD